MHFLLGYGLSVLSTLWLSRILTVIGASDAASAAVVPTLTVWSFSLFSTAVPTSAALPPSIPSASRPSAAPIPTTLATVSSSAAQTPGSAPFSSALPSMSPSQNVSIPNGADYGRVVIINNCDKALNVRSEGAHKLGGLRDGKDARGWGTEEDRIPHRVDPGANYTEPFRLTCPLPADNANATGYCADHDKLYAQGISMKVSLADAAPPKAGEPINILQIEYALVKNPFRGDSFWRLDYDISLLDCANPMNYPEVYSVNLPQPVAVAGAPAPSPVPYTAEFRNVAALTDVAATGKDHQFKVDKCPGYENGVTVSFPSDTEKTKCQTIDCDGKDKCLSIYTFDRTREGEPSKACHEEYRGDMVVHLCAKSAGNVS